MSKKLSGLVGMTFAAFSVLSLGITTAGAGECKIKPEGAELVKFAKLRQIERSGIKAVLTFIDTGSELIITGLATGLDPSQTYVSLLYDAGSKPRGGDACLPTDDSLTFGQMVVNFWEVRLKDDGTSTASLTATKSGDSYAPLDTIGTTSIRLDMQPGEPLPPAADPNRFVIQACGKVK